MIMMMMTTVTITVAVIFFSIIIIVTTSIIITLTLIIIIITMTITIIIMSSITRRNHRPHKIPTANYHNQSPFRHRSCMNEKALSTQSVLNNNS